MRQNAVSSAPQNEAPTHSEETSATIPTVVEASCRRRMPSIERALGRGREDRARVGDHRGRELRGVEHAAGDEQRDQRQREDRQQQVVRHHRREAGQTVLVGLAPEGGDGSGGAVHTARNTVRADARRQRVGRRRVLRGEHFGDAQAELLVDHDDLAAGDRLAVDQQVDGLAGEPVEGHDRPRAQRERLADGHPRATHLDGQLDGHVVQARELLGRDGRGSRRLHGPGRGGLEGCVIDGFGHGVPTGR